MHDVKSTPSFDRPLGALDMVGNVWEWTITRKHVARWRGASFASPVEAGLVYLSRDPGYRNFRGRHVGFRCVSRTPIRSSSSVAP